MQICSNCRLSYPDEASHCDCGLTLGADRAAKRSGLASPENQASRTLGPLDPRPLDIDLGNLSGAGQGMAAVVGVATLGAGLFINRWMSAHLPSGRYPQLLFLVPTVAIGLALFGIGVLVFRMADLPLIARDARERFPTDSR